MTKLPEINRKRRGHSLYPPKSLKIPPLGATENIDDPLVRLHLFVGSWDWYVLEWDPETGEAFGFVKGLDDELGYFSLVEMEATLARGIFPIERDCYWHPVPLSAITRTVRA